MHFIDLPLMKTNLLQSIYYLHGQPPLYNLFVGLVVNLFPEHYGLALHVVYLVLGLSLAVGLVILMLGLGVSPALSVLLAGLFVASPATVLYENWLFYTYPVTVLLVLATVFLHRFLAKGQVWHGLGFFSLLAAIVLIRSLFHLAWFLLVAWLLVLLQPGRRKQVVCAVAAPLMIVLFVYVKNLALFGQFTTSTWLGASLSKLTLAMPLAERQTLVHEGKLSRFALMHPFGSVRSFRPYIPDQPVTGIPILDQETKADGSPNAHNRAFIDIYGRYLRDAMYVIRHRPMVYLRSVLRAWAIWFFPTSDFVWLAPNGLRVRPLVEFWTAVFSGTLIATPCYKTYASGHDFADIGFFSVLAFVSALVFGLVGCRVSFSQQRPGSDEAATQTTVLVMVLTILYVAVVGNAADIGENNRFRFMVEPLVLVLVGLLFDTGLRRFRKQLLMVLGILAVAGIGAFALQRAFPNPRIRGRQLVYAADISLARGDFDRAEAELRRAVELDPKSADARFRLATVLAGRGELNRAIAEFQEAVRLKPDEPDFRQQLAVHLAYAGRFDAARRELRELRCRYPFSAEVANYLGLTWRLEGRLDSAIAEFCQALTLDSLAPELSYNLGSTLLAAGENRSAIIYLDRALRSDPSFGPAMVSLAAAYDSIGQPDSATVWRARSWTDGPEFRYRYAIWKED